MLQESEFLQHFSHITQKLSWSQESITIQDGIWKKKSAHSNSFMLYINTVLN